MTDAKTVMTTGRILSLFVAVLLLGAANEARGQVHVAVGVRGGYEVEKGDPLGGINALFDPGLPIKLGLTADYYSYDSGIVNEAERNGHIILGSQLRLNLFPAFLPASLYVQGGPVVQWNLSCNAGNCANAGVNLGLGMDASLGRLQPFLQAEATRGIGTLYILSGGMRISIY